LSKQAHAVLEIVVTFVAGIALLALYVAVVSALLAGVPMSYVKGNTNVG
jgi:hypothetical protein